MLDVAEDVEEDDEGLCGCCCGCCWLPSGWKLLLSCCQKAGGGSEAEEAVTAESAAEAAPSEEMMLTVIEDADILGEEVDVVEEADDGADEKELKTAVEVEWFCLLFLRIGWLESAEDCCCSKVGCFCDAA